jgi:hypothetical protein
MPSLPDVAHGGAGRMDEAREVEAGSSHAAHKRRQWIALGLLLVIAGLAWRTIDPGRIRSVVLIVLAAFAARILFARGHLR